MELLAPAGSKEAFIAALRAGADAVYLGVENYNARLNAPNLNLYDLEVLAAYAHERNVRVYLAFNTLVKQNELADAARKLARAAALRPDGIIVQDAGVAELVRRHYPSLPLHASTQMAVHNSYGVRELAARGFRRAVLARELSFAELKRIAHKTPLELEVFCHGALCFSVSGMCLFSSALGSLSGNRGRCTQPCRRLWKKGGAAGYLFSPKDLQLAEHVPALKEIGIAALKIEGRMRSAEYVFRVVKAYRVLIDAALHDRTAALQEARELLDGDYARGKTTFLFAGPDPAIFTPGEAQCLGKKIGSITAVTAESVTIAVEGAVKKGDRLRMADPAGDRTKTFTVNECTQHGREYTFPLAAGAFAPGTPVFKAGDAEWDEKSLEKEVDAAYRWFKRERQRIDAPLSAAPRMLTGRCPSKNSGRGEQLWVKCDDPAWLDVLNDGQERLRIVLYLTRENLHRLKAAVAAAAFPPERLAVELTPYIGEREIAEYDQAVTALLQAGITRWFLNNIAQFGFFPAAVEKYAGPFLYAWNTAAVRFFQEAGVLLFTTSWEDDFRNIHALSAAASGARFLTYLFGAPPLARSKMLLPGECRGGTVNGDGGRELTLAYESGAGVLIPARPVVLFGQKEKLAKAGIADFGIDLSFLPPQRALWNTVRDAYLGRKKIPEDFTFNFHRGVR